MISLAVVEEAEVDEPGLPEAYDLQGWTLVPNDPTKAMLHAAAKAMSRDERPTKAWMSVRAKHTTRYCAMVAAAPKPVEGSEWLDMASAPKDGTRFLATVLGEVDIVSWSKRFRYWQSWSSNCSYDAAFPECWTPMPKPWSQSSARRQARQEEGE